MTARPRRRWLRWVGGALLGFALLVGALVVTGNELARRKMARTVDVAVAPLAARDDAASRERGRYLFLSRGCIDCHGNDGGGRVFIDNGGMRVAGPGIAPGPGSVVAAYRLEDWDRAVRHGVAPGGRPLLVMPSEDYSRWTDGDLLALVAWLRSMPAVPAREPAMQLSLPVRLAYGFGMIEDAAAKIDHRLAPAAAVPEGVNAAHGAYVAGMCVGCHGPALAGGRIPGGPPEWPPAADLRPGPAMAPYADVDAFARMFKTGKRPDGSAIAVMPFESLREMNDTDVRALHLHLRSLPTAGAAR